jgi:hypothetical protein
VPRGSLAPSGDVVRVMSCLGCGWLHRVTGSLRESQVAVGVTDGLVKLQGVLSDLVGSWVAMEGYPWPLGVTVDLCQSFTNALHFKMKLVTHR